MIRHSSSFFISLIFHTALLLLLFFVYKSVAEEPKQEEKMVCVQLCTLSYAEKKEETVPHEAPHAKEENIPPIEALHAKKEPLPKKIEKTITPKPQEALKKIQTAKTVSQAQELPKELPVTSMTAKETQAAEQAPTPVALEQTAEEKTKEIQEEYLDAHLQKIVKLLQENLYYPRSARERGIVGAVVVRFTILENAEVQNIEIISSKSEVLSKAAIKTIENLSGSFPKPKENLLLQLPIHYNLK